tara:strand:- start:1254 stop:1946 length:693 start_codon:yes stop_codon:yes gene_type:complete
MKHSKRYLKSFETVDRNKEYGIDEAVDIISKMDNVGFDETIEVAINLGVDPKHADQIVRGTVALPNGTGKEVKVLVLAKGDNVAIAESAGADYVGGSDFVEKIKGGWFDMDAVIATPDMMGEVGKIGRVLGPRGLMPNPKAGTVTNDVSKAIKEIKSGRIEFRVDKNGIIHNGIGKKSFGKEKIVQNFNVFFDAIMKAKPQAAKGTYLKKISCSSTMGPGFKIDKGSLIG